MKGKCFLPANKTPARPQKPWATGFCAPKGRDFRVAIAFILMLTSGLRCFFFPILHFCSLPLFFFFRISCVLLTFFFPGVPLHLAVPYTSSQSSLTHGYFTWICHLNRNLLIHLRFPIFLKISLPSVL